MTKGIVLAGGSGTRLYPMTKHIGKSALPIHDKPMIYYPVSTLMSAGIREILVISTPRDLPFFKELLKDGSQLGMNFYYQEQSEPRGLADAFIVGKDFIGQDNTALILGDNVFHGNIQEKMRRASQKGEGATIFGYQVKDPERYGVIEFDKNKKPLSIEEKPKNPKSDCAVVGLYFYDNQVVEIAESLKPSYRGELEITDVNKEYLNRGNLDVELMGEGFAWLDTGTPESLGEASLYIETIQKRQNTLIGSPEEKAFRNSWIDKKGLENLVKEGQLDKSEYGKYLLRLTKPNIL